MILGIQATRFWLRIAIAKKFLSFSKRFAKKGPAIFGPRTVHFIRVPVEMHVLLHTTKQTVFAIPDIDAVPILPTEYRVPFTRLTTLTVDLFCPIPM